MQRKWNSVLWFAGRSARASRNGPIVFGSGHVPQRMMILGGSGVTVLVYPALVLAALIALA